LKIESSNRDALLALASAHLALHHFNEAAKIYERESENSPTDSMAWYGRAICYENLAEAASKSLSLMPGGMAYSKRLLGEYLQSTGDSRLAREAFGESSSLASATSPEAAKQYEMARELAEKSRYAFEHLAQIAPDSWQASVFLGDVARQHGDLVTAVAQYQKAVEQQPENPAPLLGLATSYWEMGDFDRATSYLRHTLEINPNSQQALFELANIAVRRHEDKEAIPLLKQYLATQPDALAARADLGRAYSHLGEYKEAIPELQKAASIDEQGDIHYELSVALNKAGRSKAAATALEQSKAIRKAQLERARQLHSDPSK
jgi:tetratricopeptide (TPR) repeat protein